MRRILRPLACLTSVALLALLTTTPADAQWRGRYAAQCSTGQCGSVQYQVAPQVSYASPAVQPVTWGYVAQATAQAAPAMEYAPPTGQVRTVAYTTATAPAIQPQPQADPYGFTAWLNGVRAQYGLGAVGYDPNLAAWAAANSSRGYRHSVMGPARRQNVGMGAFGAVCSMWLSSGAHRVALLDPSITQVGIAYVNGVWTFNGN